MNCRRLVVVALPILLWPRVAVLADEQKAETPEVVRIGGIAYSPKTVTIFRNLKTYLNRQGFRCDYVLYSSDTALVDALERGEIHIAWTSPVPHARYHLRAGGSQALAMRDVDANLRVTLVASAEAKIKSPADLAGKRLILGSSGNAEGALLPVHYLKNEGVDLKKLTIVSLDKETDAQGRRANSSQHVLAALAKGRGDAAVVLEKTWDRSTQWRKEHPTITQVWSSPEFCHCTFTAPADFDTKLGGQFTHLITNMDPKDPLVAELNRLEHAGGWLPADAKGFEALYDALENKAELLKPAQK